MLRIAGLVILLAGGLVTTVHGQVLKLRIRWKPIIRATPRAMSV